MAVKMTKQGTLPVEPVYKGVCPRCKSEYEAIQDDLEYYADYYDSYHKSPCLLKGCDDVVYFNRVK
jgi:hypothetical protein